MKVLRCYLCPVIGRVVGRLNWASTILSDTITTLFGQALLRKLIWFDFPRYTERLNSGAEAPVLLILKYKIENQVHCEF